MAAPGTVAAVRLFRRGAFLIEVAEDLLESLPRERGECFGHDPDRPAAGPASLDINTKYAFQALRLYALWVR